MLVVRKGQSENCYYLQQEKPAKRSVKKKKTAWGKYLVVLLVLGYVLFSFGRVEWQIYCLDKQIKTYEYQRQLLQIENAALEIRAKKLHDQEYIETLARESLGLIKSGEKVLMEAKNGNNED